MTLSNLIIGQQYLVKYFVADYRGFPNDRTLTLTSGAAHGMGFRAPLLRFERRAHGSFPLHRRPLKSMDFP